MEARSRGGVAARAMDGEMEKAAGTGVGGWGSGDEASIKCLLGCWVAADRSDQQLYGRPYLFFLCNNMIIFETLRPLVASKTDSSAPNRVEPPK